MIQNIHKIKTKWFHSTTFPFAENTEYALVAPHREHYNPIILVSTKSHAAILRVCFFNSRILQADGVMPNYS